ITRLGGCGSSVVKTVATGATSVIGVAGTSTLGAPLPHSPRWHIFAFHICGDLSTAVAKFDIGKGNTVSTCTTVTPLWRLTTANTAAPNFANSGGVSELFNVPGDLALCYKDGGSGGGTTLSISYDYY